MNNHEKQLKSISGQVEKHFATWGTRHINAVRFPRGNEVGYIDMLRGWLWYADNHHNQFDSGIGEDYYTGDIWSRIGIELRALLNTDIGQRLDLGTLDGIILESLKAEGFSEDGERL